jgi:hypothetical protein
MLQTDQAPPCHGGEPAKWAWCVGLAVAVMSRDDAIARIQEFWSQPG